MDFAPLATQDRVLLFLLVVILAILIVCLCATKTHKAPIRGGADGPTHVLKPAGGPPHAHFANLDTSGTGHSTVQMGHGHQISRFEDRGVSLRGQPLDHLHEIANIGDFIVPTTAAAATTGAPSATA